MVRPTHWRQSANGAFRLIESELSRLLDDYLQPAAPSPPGPRRAPSDARQSAWKPAVDIYDTPAEMIVTVEIPGVDQSTLDLAVTGHTLSVQGTKAPIDLPEPMLRIREREFGHFRRDITLPNDVEFDAATASVNQGVLIIRLPKRTASQPRTIPIRSTPVSG